MSLRPGFPLGVGPLGAKQPRLSLRRLGRTTLATTSWSFWRRFAASMPRTSTSRFVAGLWRWERVLAKGKARRARLILTPFRPLSPAEKEALEEEGESLLAFLVGETEDGAHLNEVVVEW